MVGMTASAGQCSAEWPGPAAPVADCWPDCVTCRDLLLPAQGQLVERGGAVHAIDRPGVAEGEPVVPAGIG